MRPLLVLMTGVPGSGKTSLSRGWNGHPGLLDHVPATYVDKDRINDIFTDRREGEFYDRVREKTYKIIDRIVDYNLSNEISVLVDATYSTEVQNEGWAGRFFSMAEAYDAKMKMIRCVAPEEIIRERLIRRGYERDRWKLENWDAFLQKEPIHTPLQGGIEVDTSKEHTSNIQRILDYLSA